MQIRGLFNKFCFSKSWDPAFCDFPRFILTLCLIFLDQNFASYIFAILKFIQRILCLQIKKVKCSLQSSLNLLCYYEPLLLPLRFWEGGELAKSQPVRQSLAAGKIKEKEGVITYYSTHTWSITKEELSAWFAYKQNWKTKLFHRTRRLPNSKNHMGHEVLANANGFACQRVEQFEGALYFIIKSNK